MYRFFEMAGCYTSFWGVEIPIRRSQVVLKNPPWEGVFDKFQTGIVFGNPWCWTSIEKIRKEIVGPFSNQTVEQAPAEGSKKGVVYFSQGPTLVCQDMMTLRNSANMCCCMGKI